MAQINVVVIGASAGGLEAITSIVRDLPNDIRTPLLIVVHTRAEGTSYLDRILRRDSVLPVSFAVDGEDIEPGRIYVAPPDLHLIVRGRSLHLVRGPKENGFRPAVDPLFRSAAQAFGEGLMGVVLSGALDDGSYGLKVIKDAGGTAVVQDPREATHPEMPMNAMRVVQVDHVLDAAGIAALIVERTGTAEGAAKGDEDMARQEDPDPQNSSEETDVEEMEYELGPPSGLTCPDCGGALWEIEDGALARYRCHVGHQYTADGLDSEQSAVVEGALWSAVRALEEHADVRKRMARRALEGGMELVANGFTDSARDSQRQAHTIRGLLFGRMPAAPSASPPQPQPRRRSAKKAKTRRRR